MTTVNKKISDYKVGECYVQPGENEVFHFFQIKENIGGKIKYDAYTITPYYAIYNSDQFNPLTQGVMRIDEALYDTIKNNFINLLDKITEFLQEHSFSQDHLAKNDLRIADSGEVICVKDIDKDGYAICTTYGCSNGAFMLIDRDINMRLDEDYCESAMVLQELKCISNSVASMTNFMFHSFFFVTGMLLLSVRA